MKKTYVLFSFDTEDFTSELGAEGILRVAGILNQNGIKGTFQVVGRLAEALVKWGRRDIIAALKEHDIGLHSHDHSVHPNMVEITDAEEYASAYEKIRADEESAINTLRHILGAKDFTTACPPGCDTSYVAHYVYADLGFSLYSGEWPLYFREQGRPIFFCNLLSLDYSRCLDNFLIQSTPEEIDAYIEKAAEQEICILFHHPQMAYYRDFWDIVNYCGTNTPEAEWKEAPRRPIEETELFYERLYYLMAKLKADPRFEIVTHRTLAEAYREKSRVLKREELPSIKQALDEAFFPLTLPDSYSLSDLFLACRDFLLGSDEHPCAKVYGFLKEPSRLSAPAVVTRGNMVRSAEALTDGFLPAAVSVGSFSLNPAEWLYAALSLLTSEENAVSVSPRPWQLSHDALPQLSFSYQNMWLFGEYLKGDRASRGYAMQSWTCRFPKGSNRFP